MLSFKKFLLIVIGVIVVVGLLITFNSNGSTQEIESIKDKTYSAIDISSDNSNIIIKPSKNSTTTVELEGDKKKIKKQTLTANVKGDTLKINVKEKRWFGISFDFSFKSVELIVHVPEKQYDALMIKSKNGRIQMEDLEVTTINAKTNNGRIVMEEVVSSDTDIKTNNGRIELLDLNITTINAETDNGRIVMDQVVSSDIDIETDNGRIELYNVEGEIKGLSDNGRIYYEANDFKDPVELTTKNGRILVVIDKEPKNATFTANSNNGKVEIFGQSTNSVTFGNGNPTMKLKSSSGRITVSNEKEE